MAISIFQSRPTSPSPIEIRSLLDEYTQGNAESALARAQALSLKFPKHPLAWGIMGAIYRSRHEHAKALPCLKRVVEATPTDARAHFNLANALRDLGHSHDAADRYHRALKIDPSLPNGFFHLGNMQHETGQLALAERSFRKALELSPDHVECMSNLAHVLQDGGRHDEAMALYDRALALRPMDIALLFNRVDLLHERGLLQDAETESRRIIAMAPSHAPAYAQLANILMDAGDHEAAIRAFRAAINVEPKSTESLGRLLYALNYLPRTSPEECLALARKYGDIVHMQAQEISQQWAGNASPVTLRVGLVSADLRNHPVGYFLESVLSCFNANRVCLVAINTQNFEDELTRRIRPFFGEWHSIAGMPDADAIAHVRALGLHLVIDLSGHTTGGRLSLFGSRMAPIQASWLGYFATTGVPEMDYLIADPLSLPAECEGHFTETIWRLPDTRLCFTAPKVRIDPGPLPALVNGYVTFGCTSNLMKLNASVIALWSRILLSVPGSRLLLQAKQLVSQERREKLEHEFVSRGVQSERLILEPPAERGEYLRTYQRVDFCLDPFPFPGGTTTAESLWMGVPVLTLSGDTFLSKQGASLLSAVGLDNWVATSEDMYLERAVQLLGDIPALSGLRQRLRQMALSSPLFDAARFAANLENAFWDMWQSASLASNQHEERQ